jgi:hypothetical protein
MTDDLQHCPACQEEYVAGVAACVECGGALQPGPLERRPTRGRARSSPGAASAADPAPPPDRLLVQLPGLQAHHMARALLREGIRCRAECAGGAKLYLPDQPPVEPLAVTLPVSLYVDDDHYDAAQEILEAPLDEDTIGDQWAESEIEATAEEGDDDESIALPMAPSPPPAGAAETVLGDDPPDDDAPAAESTTLRTVVLIVLAAIVLLFVFGR